MFWSPASSASFSSLAKSRWGGMSTALASNCRDDRLCFVLRPFPPLGWSPGPAALAAKPTDRWKSGGADFDGAAAEVVVAVAVRPLHLARGAEEWRWW